eukprot:95218_1
MGNTSSHRNRHLSSQRNHNVIEQLEQICNDNEFAITTPSKPHCLRVLVGPTTIVTSINPHILLKIVTWHKQEYYGIGFNLHVSTTKNNPNESVFKISLTNKNIKNNIWRNQLIQYINNTTSYHLNCV